MGDYLSNLVRRSFNPTAGVQPRLPSRYEPSGYEPSGYTPSSPQRLVQEVLLVQAEPTRLWPDEASQSFPSTTLAGRSNPAALPSPATPASVAPVSSPLGRSPVTDGILPHPAQPTPAEQPIERSTPPHTVAVSQQSPVQRQAQSLTQFPNQFLEQFPEQFPDPVMPRSSLSSPLQPQITIAPKDAETSPSSASGAAAFGSPPVRVTIGRIEVRAVAPSSSTRSSTQPRPSLDLESYLKSRHGGRS